MEDADQIFLFQRKVWTKRLIQYSIVYYIGLNFIMTLFLGFVLAPFLFKHYYFASISFLKFILLTLLLKTSLGILKQFLQFRFKGWKQNLTKAVCLVLSSVYLRVSVSGLINRSPFFGVSCLFLLIVLGLLIRQRITLSGSLLEDISIGQDDKLKFANVLLKFTGTYVKKPITLRTRPWLFRNSNLIYRRRNPENGLVELCLKSTLRHGANLKFYLYVVGAYGIMLTAFPPSYKWGLWGVSILFLTTLVKMYWLEAANSPYVLLFPLRAETKFEAASRSLFVMALPGEILLLLFVVIQTHQLLYALILLPLGILLGKFTAKKLALFS